MIIGSITNWGEVQGQVNDANGLLTGVISNAGLLGGQVVGMRGLKGDTGDTGASGADGHSPVVTASKTDKTTTVYVDGSPIATLLDGNDGADGYSPSASVSKVGSTATITITDKGGTTTASISDGEQNVQSDWNEADSTADDYIKNKPTIPSATSTTPKMDGTASVGSETTWAKGDHVHPTDTSRASSSHTHTKSDITDFPTLATVATSGDYDDLIDKPTIHNVPSGGSSGQVLAKDSNDDYDVSWVNQSGGGGSEIVYCTCTDSASTVAKTATVVNGSFTSLTTGSQVAVKFTYTNTATNPTLNVNSTGAKAIMRGGTAHVGTNANESWNAGTVVYMLYDGSVWNIVGWLNTTYTGGTGSQIITGTEALNKVWSPQQIHDGIVGLADANVQSDWNQADTTADDFIKNKPTIHNVPSGGTSGQVLTKDSNTDYDVSWEDPKAHSKYLSGNWTATSSSATGTRLTDELNLTKGIWIVSFSVPPYTATNRMAQVYLEGNDYRVANAMYLQGFWIVQVPSTKTVAVYAGAGATCTWDSAYLARGGIQAVRIAEIYD